MSLLGFLASPWFAIVFFILFVIGLVVTFIVLANSDIRLLSVGTGIITVLFLVGWIFSATHRMVPLNQSALVLDTTTSKLVGSLRPSGLTSKPFVGAQIIYFPANSNFEWCPEFKPSTQGSYEVIVTPCYYLDASKIDWTNQYLARQGNADVVLNAIKNAMSEDVAKIVRAYEPLELTTKRDEISAKLYDAGKEFLKNQGIPLNSVSLKNWDFTSQSVKDAFDQAAVAQTLVAKAQADRDAAVVERQAQEYRAETSNNVASKLAQGYLSACQTLGIKTESAMLSCVSTLWVAGLKQTPQNLVIGVGAQPNIAIPANSPTSIPVAQPTPTP